MCISDLSSDVCASDLESVLALIKIGFAESHAKIQETIGKPLLHFLHHTDDHEVTLAEPLMRQIRVFPNYTKRAASFGNDRSEHFIQCIQIGTIPFYAGLLLDIRSEEPTSELQSLMRISYADFRLK